MKWTRDGAFAGSIDLANMVQAIEVTGVDLACEVHGPRIDWSGPLTGSDWVNESQYLDYVVSDVGTLDVQGSNEACIEPVTGLQRVELEVDGDVVATSTQPSGRLSLNVNQFESGLHRLSITAYFKNGTSSEKTNLMFRVDHDPPQGEASAPRFADGTAQITGGVSDSHSGPEAWRAEVSISGGPWTPICTVSAPGPYSCQWDTTQVAEGRHELRPWLTDLVSNQQSNSGPGPTSSVTIDRSPPQITLSGDLAGENGPPGQLHVLATDGNTAAASARRSGVRRVQVLVDGIMSRQEPLLEQECPQSSCSVEFDWTVDATALTDGCHTISVIATDQLNHASAPAQVAFFTDRDGVYHAKEYTGDPANGGQLLGEEWVGKDAPIVRVQEEGAVRTRGPGPCVPNDSEADRGTEGRDATDFGTFTMYRSPRDDDERIQQPASLERWRQLSGSPIESGLLLLAKESWQTPPPGSGPLYDVYEIDITADETPASEEDDLPPELVVRKRRIWVERLTKLPIKTTGLNAQGDTVSRSFFTYENRMLEPHSLGRHFFNVPRPADTRHEKIVEFQGTEDVSNQTDQETGAQFTPYFLGFAPQINGLDLCFADLHKISFRDTASDPITNPEQNIDDVSADGSLEGPPHRYAEETTTDATYGATDSCVPAVDFVQTPALEVFSVAVGSTQAAAWRDVYIPAAQEIENDPQHVYAGVAGLFSVSFEGETRNAYVIPLDDQRMSVLIETAMTQIAVSGPFDGDDLPTLLGQLEPR